jgi:hypothetical protein
MPMSLLSLVIVAAGPAQAVPDLAFLGAPIADRLTLIMAFLLFSAWIFLCDWMARDVPWVGAERNLWFGIGMGTGAAGFLLMLMLPSAGASLTGWALLIAGQCTAYVIYRNAIVPSHLRVLTPEWFKNLLSGKGSRFGDARFMDKAPVDIKWMDGPSTILDPPPESDDLRVGFNAACHLIYDAVNRRATDLSMTPSVDGKYAVKVVIDGFTNTDRPVDKRTAMYVLMWVKQTGRMDLGEHRKPQKGKINVMVGRK